MRRFVSKALLRCLVFVSLFCISSKLWAYDINRVTPLPGSGRIFTTELGKVGPHLELSSALYADYTYAPLQRGQTLFQITDEVTHRINLQLAIGLSLWKFIQVGMLVPFVPYQQGIFTDISQSWSGWYRSDVPRYLVEGAGIGELQFFTKFVFWENSTSAVDGRFSGGVGASLQVGIGATSVSGSGRFENYTGSLLDEYTIRSSLIGHVQYGTRWVFSFNPGIWFHPGHLGLTFGLGGQYLAWKHESKELSVFAELSGLSELLASSTTIPSTEVLLGVKASLWTYLKVTSGVGIGFPLGRESPLFRIFVSVGTATLGVQAPPPPPVPAPVPVPARTEAVERTTVERNVYINHVIQVKGGKIDIPVMSFSDLDEQRPKETDVKMLDAVAILLNARLDIHLVRIEGHTDNQGSDEYNLDLSLRRATFVRNYLIQRGVQAERLEVEGFGFHCPIASNESIEGQAQNRRVEFVIVKQDGYPDNNSKCAGTSRRLSQDRNR